ncbi:MAG TPA: hypothetical protein DDW19_08685 [Anaerolineaceae bacterium]|jgi:hypothetical protein|nr:hypothetical protein [Anaerolineaceae bacterium]
MGLFSGLFKPRPYPSENRKEVADLIDELIRIGKLDDYLSEHPGGQFNAQCRHIGAIRIGRRLDAIGGLPLMQYAQEQVRRKAGKNLSSHLEYAWDEVGSWIH